MSVRQSLLAILDQGPCYGYQLRTEFARRTGGSWSLNVGQIYNTLDRLERDGLAERAGVDEQGHVFWRITDQGSAEVRRWLHSPVERAAATRDELAMKLAVAATLPGVDVGRIIRDERRASRQRLTLLEAGRADEPATDAGALAHELVADSMRFAAEAELKWLDHAEARLSSHRGRPLALSTDRPKRGRPARAIDPVAVD